MFVARVESARWVCFDTSFHVTCEDLSLSENAFVPLGRSTPFPLDGRPLMTFDASVTVEELMDARARAHRLLMMLGGTAPVPAALSTAGVVWLFSDTAYSRFGTEVPVEALGRGDEVVIREADGLIHFDDMAGDGPRWTAMQRISRSDMDLWTSEKRMGAGRHPAISSVRRPAPIVSGGSRPPILFREAAASLVRPTTGPLLDGSIFAGPAVFPEVAEAVARSGLEPNAYVLHYLDSVGVSRRSGLGHELISAFFLIYAITCVDGLNASHLVAIEHLSRRIVQAQRAIRVNAKTPDFAGLRNYMRHLDLATGAAFTPNFDKHIMEENKSLAVFAKHAKTLKDTGGDPSDPDVNPKGGGKGSDAKAKAKAKA